MRSLLCCCCFIITCYAFGQQHALVKQWDKRYGGLLSDELYSCIPTADGGYLLGGGVYSGLGGDKTQDNWDTTYNTYDFWVVKVDSVGDKQWDKRFGGYGDDGIGRSSLVQNHDGSYILAGTSSSGIGGDKTQSSWGRDYWIVKIDSAGNKLWDKRYGGFGNDVNFANQITSDGGFILGGYTYSPQGGDISQPARGSVDYWVVKTDNAGNKQWDARFGGVGFNFFSSLVQTKDGGYLLGGESNSDSSGDKTQNTTTPNNDYNYWVVQIDSVGNKLWDKTYGSNMEEYLKCLIKTADGGFLLGGYSYGTVGYDKTSPNCDAFGGTLDYWIVKIDSAGNKLWDKDYGGSADDQLFSLALTNDGGYLLAGDSRSPASCQKSENNTAYALTWVIKTDSSGNMQWDKTILLNGNTAIANAFQKSDGSYIIGSFTGAEVGYYKSQPAWDSSADYWIVKFCDTTIFTETSTLTDNVQLTLYPNPFTTDLNILLQKQNLKQATFTITNPLGQIIYTKQENNLSPGYTKMLDLSYLPNGVYFVEVVVDGENIVKQIIKSP